MICLQRTPADHRWDETPGGGTGRGGETPGATPGQSTRQWDATPGHATPGRETPSHASQPQSRRNRWDETPKTERGELTSYPIISYLWIKNIFYITICHKIQQNEFTSFIQQSLSR